MTSLPYTYDDIDWVMLRDNALAQKGWKEKSSAEWDKKAESFAKRNYRTEYVDLFLNHLHLKDSDTVLDVGCGPGTLALPIAPLVKEVTAIDYSPKMIQALQSQMKAEDLTNITPLVCSWEDDWTNKGIQSHDIIICSRSMGVKNLEEAIRKITSFSRKYCFVTDRVGATPFEAEAFQAIGRTFSPGPDYIYTINTLYSLGIHPNVTMLELNRDMTFSSIEESVSALSWMFHDLTQSESKDLENYLHQQIIVSENNTITIRRRNPPKWALIWWKTTK